VSESAVSAKRGWVQFGAKSAPSETPVRAAAKRRCTRRADVGKRWRSLPFENNRGLLGVGVNTQKALTGIGNRSARGIFD
jgi:hypothetical protein